MSCMFDPWGANEQMQVKRMLVAAKLITTYESLLLLLLFLCVFSSRKMFGGPNFCDLNDSNVSKRCHFGCFEPFEP